MMRIGTPFLASVKASTIPLGPAPTCRIQLGLTNVWNSGWAQGTYNEDRRFLYWGLIFHLVNGCMNEKKYCCQWMAVRLTRLVVHLYILQIAQLQAHQLFCNKHNVSCRDISGSLNARLWSVLICHQADSIVFYHSSQWYIHLDLG